MKLPQFKKRLQTHADSVIGVIIGARGAISESSNRSRFKIYGHIIYFIFF